MKAQKKANRLTAQSGTASVRATISFPPGVYESLETIAKEKRVSLAWVVREATEKYIEDRWPLFKGQG